MRDFILEYWLTALFGVCCAALSAACKYLYTRLSATERGIQALLREQIVCAYYRYAGQGWITLHGLDSMEKMYEGYHNLGGNGAVTALMEAMRAMPVKDTATEERRKND